MAQSAVPAHVVSLLYSLTNKFRTTLVPCACIDSFAVGPKSAGTSVIPFWKSVRNLTNQEQAFNRPQTCRGEFRSTRTLIRPRLPSLGTRLSFAKHCNMGIHCLRRFDPQLSVVECFNYFIIVLIISVM